MSDYLLELRAAEAIAREAGKRIVQQRSAGFTVSLKAKNDLVTDVDRATEVFIRDQLHRLFPDDTVFGEEYGLDAPRKSSPSRRQWLVDPIDGTINFTMGIPMYCVSIALQSDNNSVVGVIYDPSRDELFSARRGGGAMLDGQPISTSAETELENALLVTGFPARRSPEYDQTLEQFTVLTRESRGVRRLGSAAIDLAYVAAGRLDGFWEYGLSPWDTAAGYLLVQEAGGTVTDIQNQHYTCHEPSLLATNGHIHNTMLTTLARSIARY